MSPPSCASSCTASCTFTAGARASLPPRTARAAARRACRDVGRHLRELLDALPCSNCRRPHRLHLARRAARAPCGVRRRADARRSGTRRPRRASSSWSRCCLSSRELVAKRLALGLRFLLVAHPLGAARLERPSASSSSRALLSSAAWFPPPSAAPSRSAAPLAKARDLVSERLLRLEERLAPPFLAASTSRSLQLGVRAHRREGARALQLRAPPSPGDLRELALEAIAIARSAAPRFRRRGARRAARCSASRSCCTASHRGATRGERPLARRSRAARFRLPRQRRARRAPPPPASARMTASGSGMPCRRPAICGDHGAAPLAHAGPARHGAARSPARATGTARARTGPMAAITLSSF